MDDDEDMAKNLSQYVSDDGKPLSAKEEYRKGGIFENVARELENIANNSKNPVAREIAQDSLNGKRYNVSIDKEDSDIYYHHWVDW